jgi:hypothetical protein
MEAFASKASAAKTATTPLQYALRFFSMRKNNLATAVSVNASFTVGALIDLWCALTDFCCRGYSSLLHGPLEV